jgi:ribosomal protein S18 acetylase RimI-like enzyme
MFNAAFLSEPVATTGELEKRLDAARARFEAKGRSWAFWLCEDWLERPVRRRLTHICNAYGLRLSSELPGMVAQDLTKQRRALPALEVRRATGASAVSDFRAVGEACFHVPPQWFAEVFNDDVGETCPEFKCWIGYLNGLPVATAATLVSDGVIGLYNIATVPAYRGRGIAEAMTRHVVEVTRAEVGELPLILQATSLGFRMYNRLGFRETTRILVFNSIR